MANENITALVSMIRGFSSKVKDGAGRNSEGAVFFVENKLTAATFYLAGIRSVLAILNGALVALKVACTTEARATATALIKHTLIDLGSRINEAGNLVEALGQHEEFVNAVERAKKAMDVADQADKRLRKKRCMGFESGDRVVLTHLESRSDQPFGAEEGSEGTVKWLDPINRKIAKRNEFNSLFRSSYRRLHEEGVSNGVIMSVSWDKGGFDHLVLPVDKVGMLESKEEMANKEVADKIKEGLESGDYNTVSGVFSDCKPPEGE